MAAVSLEDRKLREEIESFGETVGKINEKTRPILIKKLNHLRARQRVAENPPSPTRTKRSPRKTTLAARNSSSDEEDTRVENGNTSHTQVRNLRRRTIETGYLVDQFEVGSTKSSPVRPGRRSMGTISNGDSPFLAGSLRKPDTASSPSRQLLNSKSAGDILSTPVKKSSMPKTGYVFHEDEQSFSDDEYTFCEMASTGVNTTQSLELSHNSGFAGNMVKRGNSPPANSVSLKGYGSRWLKWFSTIFSRGCSCFWSSFPWHTISQLLLACVAVFFIVVISLYVFAISSSTQSTDIGALKLCPRTVASSSCSEDDLKDVKNVVMDIAEVLSKRAGEFDCGYTLKQRDMSVESLSQTLNQLYRKQHEDLTSAFKLLIGCSECGIILLNNQKQKTEDINEIAFLESVSADKSLWCRLTTAILKVINSILLAVIGVGIGILTIYAIIRWKNASERQAKEVTKLVEEIVVLLKNHASACRYKPHMLPYVAIPHVRDALIPLAERVHKQKIWDRAVKMLSMNESRVREEVKTIDGEECSVWRWIDTFPTFSEGIALSASSSPSIKPTSSCLRICNLVETSQTYNESVISDAVLTQCGPHSGVLHIGITTSVPEGVYVKFVSEAAAAQACKLLHGWTYKGKLASVKEVGASMYRALFPDSAMAMVPLRASNRRLTDSFSSLAARSSQTPT